MDISGDGCIDSPAGFEYRALERSDVATERLTKESIIANIISPPQIHLLSPQSFYPPRFL
ncbi:hypothetical protein ES703_23345 [subsurface metagenome]